MSTIFWIGVAGMAWSMMVFVFALCFPGVYLSEPLLQELVLKSALVGPLLASICFFMTKGFFIKIIAIACFLLFAGVGCIWFLMTSDHSENEIARTQVGESIVTAEKESALLVGIASGIDGTTKRTVFIKAERKIPPFFMTVRQIGHDNDFKEGIPRDALLVPVDSNHVRWRDQVFEVK